jgi:NAD(P)-dependent dehydrogenase (short-subunit alcohol dehydrogenase family)
MQIEGSVVIVTGAGSGIGRALTAEFAAQGARVVAGDIDRDAATATAAQVGGHVVGMRADAADIADIDTLIARARNIFGPVDCFVANAGIIGAAGLGDEAAWDRILDVNLRAHIRAATALVPDWTARGRGHFVAVTSAAGLLTQIGAAGYAVSKHAAVGFAEWLAITYGDAGIGVTCVCPMGVDTALLQTIRASGDSEVRLSADAVVKAGAVVTPEEVAALTVAAVREGTFRVLPHPEVAAMVAQKAADHDRWIAGMRRYQRSLHAGED